MSTLEQLRAGARTEINQDEFRSNLSCTNCDYNAGYIDKNKKEFHCPRCNYQIHRGKYWQEMKQKQNEDFNN